MWFTAKPFITRRATLASFLLPTVPRFLAFVPMFGLDYLLLKRELILIRQYCICLCAALVRSLKGLREVPNVLH